MPSNSIFFYKVIIARLILNFKFNLVDLGLGAVEGRVSGGHTDNTKGKLKGNTPPNLVKFGAGGGGRCKNFWP